MFQFRMNDLHKLTSRAHFPNEDRLAGLSLAHGAGRRLTLKAIDSLRLHWAEYLMEAGELSIYMFTVCAFATLSWHPASPIGQFIAGAMPRRIFMGLGTGTTLIAIVMSPWGKQSGGHLNPAIALAFYRLGKLELSDMLFYCAGQFLGALTGVAVGAYVLGGALGDAAVHYAVTAPGAYGDAVAFVAEVIISFALMSTILLVSERENLSRYTPYFAGALVAAVHRSNRLYRKQCKPGTDVRAGHVRQLLARSLDLFHCAVVWDVGCGRGFPDSPWWRWSLLRQAASRHSQTLYISSRVPNSVYVFRIDAFNSNASFDARAPQRRRCHNRFVVFCTEPNGSRASVISHSKTGDPRPATSASQERDQTKVARILLCSNQSCSRYSGGTSSSGNCRVRTSATSGSGAFSMASTKFASKDCPS